MLRDYTMQLLANLTQQDGSKIKDSAIVEWVNNKVCWQLIDFEIMLLLLLLLLLFTNIYLQDKTIQNVVKYFQILTKFCSSMGPAVS